MPDRFTPHNPPAIHAPFGSLYSHGIEVPPGARLLFVAGQVGVDRDGNCPASGEEQLHLAWSNVGEVLKSAQMGMEDIVKIVCFIKDPTDADAYANSCGKYLGANKPAMTAPIVRQLWAPQWLFEIEAVAVRID